MSPVFGEPARTKFLWFTVSSVKNFLKYGYIVHKMKQSNSSHQTSKLTDHPNWRSWANPVEVQGERGALRLR
jgi:hypothetical protein